MLKTYRKMLMNHCTIKLAKTAKKKKTEIRY